MDRQLKKYSIGYKKITSVDGSISVRGIKSKPNNLEIYGYTHEIGRGEKSPDNKYVLESLDSGKISKQMIHYGNKNRFVGEFFLGKGYPSFTGNIAVNSNASYCDIVVQENTKYSLSKKSTTNFYTYTIVFLDENKSKLCVGSADSKYNTISNLSIVKSGNYFIKATFTTPQNCRYIRIGWLTTSEIPIQLELGDSVTEFIEPCNSICTDEHSIILLNNDMNIQVPVPIALNSIDGVSDYIYKDSDGIWKLVQNIDELNTSEIDKSSWIMLGIYDVTIRIQAVSTSLSNCKGGCTLISDTFNCLNSSSDMQHIMSGGVNYSTTIVLFLNKTYLNVENDETWTYETYQKSFQDWIVDNNFIFLYQLEIPVEYTLSKYAQDLLNSFELQNQNEISVKGNPDIKISGYIQK